MRLTIRAAGPADAATLVDLYDGHYRGGYSACFDRYGPATPQDVWWVQSEKSVSLIEWNRAPAGLIVIGRSGKRLLAEEVLLETVPADADGALRQLHEFLVERFQRERQDALSMRCAETNAVALRVAARFGFVFVNALVVASGGGGKGVQPDGYHIRRAQPHDAAHIARLHEETLGVPLRPKDLDLVWKAPDARVFIAERQAYPVGFALAQVRDGVGRWTAGVRETHRGRGLGRGLAHQVMQFFQAKSAPPITTYWGLDRDAARFARALGARTERTYLYFERQL